MRTYTVGTIPAENLQIDTIERLTGPTKGEKRIIINDISYREPRCLASLSIHDAQELSNYLIRAVEFLTREDSQ